MKYDVFLSFRVINKACSNKAVFLNTAKQKIRERIRYLFVFYGSWELIYVFI